MKIITINLPEKYLEILEKMSVKCDTSRSELIRRAIRDQLSRDFALFSLFEQLCPDFKEEQKKKNELRKKREMKRLLELKKQRETEFYNFCIFCDSKLHSSIKPINYKGIKVMELRFCCRCFKRFEANSLEELPDYIIKKIRRKLKKHNKLRNKERD